MSAPRKISKAMAATIVQLQIDTLRRKRKQAIANMHRQRNREIDRKVVYVRSSFWEQVARDYVTSIRKLQIRQQPSKDINGHLGPDRKDDYAERVRR